MVSSQNGMKIWIRSITHILSYFITLQFRAGKFRFWKHKVGKELFVQKSKQSPLLKQIRANIIPFKLQKKKKNTFSFRNDNENKRLL